MLQASLWCEFVQGFFGCLNPHGDVNDSEVTSSVTRWKFNGTTPETLIIFRKCVVYFTYDLLCVERGLRK